MDEKQKIATSERIANQLQGGNPDTVAGHAKIARTKLAKAERDLGKSLNAAEKDEQLGIVATYDGETIYEPSGKVLFNAMLLTAHRQGIRPIETNGKLKAFHTKESSPIQYVIKKGEHVTGTINEGDKVLINIDQFMQRNVRPPILQLEVTTEDGSTELREFLVLSERDIKYILND